MDDSLIGMRRPPVLASPAAPAPSAYRLPGVLSSAAGGRGMIIE